MPGRKRRRRSPSKRRHPASRALQATTRDPQLEAIYVMLAPPPGRSGVAVARELAKRVRLAGWRVEPVLDDGSEVEIVPPRRTTARRAWDATYALRAQPEVVHADPMFRYLVPENVERRGRKAAGRARADDPATDNEFDWSLRKANVFAAWNLFGPRPPGAGVIVGHPDTGYTPHPELAEPARILVSAGYDYEDDDRDPIDDLDAELLDNPGHGTATGSVILSGVGAPSPTIGPFVSGVAPHALLMPIRTTESVVLLSMRALRQAIDHAAGTTAVVSISLGGPFAGFGTRRSIQRAVDAGTIVLAAAGNEVGFVVYPAAFDEVIACAASNIHDRPWPGSCHGRAVDITAPGESVWRATTDRDSSGAMRFRVERGSGTSFAVATTAGVAALWISFHGWQTLATRYGAGNIARVFKQLLQENCRRPSGWDPSEYGPGIVDARAVLAAPLPPTAPARKLRDARRAAVAADSTGLEAIIHLFPDAPRTRIEREVAAVLNVPERDLPQVLQDFGDELAFQLVMNRPLLATLQRAVAAGPRRGGRAGMSSPVRRHLARSGVSTRLRRQLRG